MPLRQTGIPDDFVLERTLPFSPPAPQNPPPFSTSSTAACLTCLGTIACSELHRRQRGRAFVKCTRPPFWPFARASLCEDTDLPRPPRAALSPQWMPPVLSDLTPPPSRPCPRKCPCERGHRRYAERGRVYIDVVCKRDSHTLHLHYGCLKNTVSDLISPLHPRPRPARSGRSMLRLCIYRRAITIFSVPTVFGTIPNDILGLLFESPTKTSIDSLF